MFLDIAVSNWDKVFSGLDVLVGGTVNYRAEPTEVGFVCIGGSAKMAAVRVFGVDGVYTCVGP